MKNSIYLLACIIVFACENKKSQQEPQGPPDQDRFVQEVLASNLFEPTELVVLPKGKILFTQRRGAIKQYNLNTSSYTHYDSIPVHFEEEDGLMGMALDPEFEQNEWVYLYYSPAGDEPVQHLSRFSYTASGLTNEVVMLKVPVQREECCHTGGSIEFGPDGLLYLSTGDNTNPFASEGYSPSDERPGRSAWDAQRSAANTNDLRGKILRIKPEPDGTYTIPEGNLFEDDDPLTRPEIYVMGCRNPYRIAVDQKRGWLFWGDVGPDANEDSELRGPRGHDEFNVARAPGFYGWPLFVGKNFPYREYDFASGSSAGYYDPEKPINNSPNNTGRQELPPAQPATIYYPYARFEEFPQVGNGGRNAMAGPVYYSEMFEGQDQFPEYFDGRVIYYDWMRGFIYFLELDEQGQPVDWYEFMPDTEFNNVIDITFGSDGAMYMIEYGTGWFTRNENARLSRIGYLKGNRPPVLVAEASDTRGSAPMEITFDASASSDPDGDPLKFEWEINGQEFEEPVFTYQFEEEGVYYPELILSDGKGNSRRKQFSVEVGNEPPVVNIQIEGNNSFFWEGRQVNYQVQVADLEDEADGSIDSTKISFEINHYQSTDMAEALGHKRPVSNGISLIESLDCKSCHKVEGSSIGPSYTDVARRYRNDREAVNYLSYKIISGGGGVWGEQAMSAHPDLSTKDAASIVNYILSLGRSSQLPMKGTYQTSKEEGRYLFSASYEDGGKHPLQPITVNKNVWLRATQFPGDEFDESEAVQARNGRLNSLFHGSWVGFRNIDLTGLSGIKLHCGSLMDMTVVVKTGSAEGEEIGRKSFKVDEVPSRELMIPISATDSMQDVYLVFENQQEKNKLATINYFEFIPNP